MIDRTATGIEADTVMPTFSTRYSDEAPNTMPRIAPISTAGQVNSGSWASSATNGWCPTALDGSSELARSTGLSMAMPAFPSQR